LPCKYLLLDILPHLSYLLKYGNKSCLPFYLTDKHNNCLEDVDYGTFVYLHIKTVGYIGETISVDMNNEKADYLLNGERLEKDVLKDHLVQSNEEIVELEVVEPLN